MALRVLLVGLVASLGLELPTGQDVSSWARAGRAWVDARVVEVSGLAPESEKSRAGATDVGCQGSTPSTTEMASSRADLIFEAAVEQMASEFAVDLALMEEAAPAEEVIVVVERFEEMPPAWPTGPEVEPESSSAPSPVAVPSAGAASTASKFSVAVRLTKQAVDAWASLIPAIPVKMAGDGQGDSF